MEALESQFSAQSNANGALERALHSSTLHLSSELAKAQDWGKQQQDILQETLKQVHTDLAAERQCTQDAQRRVRQLEESALQLQGALTERDRDLQKALELSGLQTDIMRTQEVDMTHMTSLNSRDADKNSSRLDPDYEEQIRALQNENQRLRNDLAHLTVTKEENARLNDDLRHVQKADAQRREAEELLRTNLHELQAEVQMLNTQMETLTAERDVLVARAETLTAERDAMAARLSLQRSPSRERDATAARVSLKRSDLAARRQSESYERRRTNSMELPMQRSQSHQSTQSAARRLSHESPGSNMLRKMSRLSQGSQGSNLYVDLSTSMELED